MAETKKISKVMIGSTTYEINDPNKPAVIEFDGNYSATTNKAATVSTVTDKINLLDGGTIGTPSTSKTITALNQTNGNVSATFDNISITKSQVSDFPTSMPASDVSTWAKAANKPSYTYSEVGAAAAKHTHSLSIATNSGTSALDLAANTKYKLTAGGKTFIFKTPADSAPVTSVNSKTGAVTLTYSDVGAQVAGNYASSSHTHGNIQNGGTLQTTDVTAASGDKLVVTDYSDSSKVARTSISFDGSTTSKALTPKGTWENFLQTHQSLSGYVPTSRKINNKALTNDIVLTINDIGATVLVVEQSNVSSLPITIRDSKITANHIVVNYILSNPSAQTGDWTVTTSNGSLQISGSINGTTNIKLILALS